MKRQPPARLWWLLALALVVLVVVAFVVQAFNSLLWQLSYLLPSWLVGPVLLLLVGGGALLLGRLAWPWIADLGGTSKGKTDPKALEPPPPRGRRRPAATWRRSIKCSIGCVMRCNGRPCARSGNASKPTCKGVIWCWWCSAPAPPEKRR